MEERWYQIADTDPVTEGDMTLLTAKLLAPELRHSGRPSPLSVRPRIPSRISAQTTCGFMPDDS